MNKTTKIILGGAAMIAVSAGVAGLTAYSMMPEEQSKSLAFDEVFPQSSHTRLAALDATQMQPVDLTKAAESSVNAVVHIKSTQESKTQTVTVRDPFYEFFGDMFGNRGGQQRQVQTPERVGFGSGVIISSDGYIVTNAHVIEGAEAVKVVLYNEEEYEAEVIGSDIQTDIAVLKIDAENLVEVELGDSSQLEIGETVYALGNPGGLSLQSSFTDGMISGLDRVINVESSYYMSVIQTSAAINPGNSGGALINEYGQVVGITSAKIISTDYEGIGFAIPTETAKPLIEDIIKNGYVSGRAMIGINVITIDSVTARYYDVPEGVQIIEINPDGSLYGTEVKVGDIITKFDGKNVTCVEDLHEYLAEHVPGDKVVMEFYRYSATGKSDFSYTVEVELKESKG